MINRSNFIIAILTVWPFISKAEEVKLYLEDIPVSVEVTKLSTTYEAVISNHIVEGLFKISDGYRVEKDLVKEATWSKSQRELTVVIKEKKFSNGVSLTSDIVIQSLNKCVLSPRNKTSLALSKVEGYKDVLGSRSKKLRGLQKINDTVFKIRLSEAAPLLIDELAMGTCNIWLGEKDDLLNGAVGTGPYKLESHSKAEIKLVRTSKAEGSSEMPSRITFTDKSSFLNNRNSYNLIISDQEKAPEGFITYEMSQLMSEHFVLNNSIKPFNNKKVRELIFDSIDYKSAHENFSVSEQRAQKGLVPFGAVGFVQRKLEKVELGIVRKKFKALGYDEKNKLKFTLTLRDTGEGKSEVQFWKKVFSKLPVDIQFNFVPTRDLFNQSVNINFQAMRVRKSAGAVDPFRLLSSYHSQSPWNTAHANSPICDKLITGAIEVQDRDKRYENYAMADNCLIQQEKVLVPLFTVNPKFVHLKKGWELTRKNRFLLYPHRVYEWVKSK